MTQRKTQDELQAARCAATSKATGSRCRRWAVGGARVCVVHGAGAPVRRHKPGPDGRTRIDPRNARLVTGLYSKRVPRELAAAVRDFRGSAANLYDLDMVAARLWALLERCDQVEHEATKGADLRDPQEAAVAIAAMEAVRRTLHEIGNLCLARARLQISGSGTIERAQVAAMLATVLHWADDLGRDERVPRDEIGRRLADRLDALVEHEALEGATPSIT